MPGDAIEGIGKIGSSPALTAATAAAAPAAQQAGAGAQAAAATDTKDQVNISDDAKAEEQKKADGAKVDDKAKEEELKKIEEQIKQTEQKMQEAQQKGDFSEALSLLNQLNGLIQQRNALMGQGDGQTPQQTAQNAGIPEGGGAPAGGGFPGGAPVGGGEPAGGGFPGGGGAPVGGGGFPGGGGAAPAGDGGAVNNTPAVQGVLDPNGSGSDAVDLARKYLGQNAIDIKGKLPNFTAAGGQTNNCADFVSSCLESTGRVKGHHINVVEFEKSLKAQGYSQVSAANAQPGDVWISNSRGHTELYAGNGRTIGANNDRPGHQVISERPKAAGTGVYYHLNAPAKK